MSEGTGYEQLSGEPKKPTGRPCSHTPEIASELCFRLSQGRSLRSVCKDNDMPEGATVFRWLQRQDEIGESFRDQYACAKRESADAMAEDMQEIADDPKLDHNHKRIAVDTRKWLASKLKPKKYGDRVALTGDENGAPLVVTWAAEPK